jgi:hypothetical protein
MDFSDIVLMVFFLKKKKKIIITRFVFFESLWNPLSKFVFEHLLSPLVFNVFIYDKDEASLFQSLSDENL